jgi:hypothetical protein
MLNFIEKCAKRRTLLPILPCACDHCVWYIRDTSFNDCFWVLSEFFNIRPGFRLSFAEIANLENLPISEVISIFENALKKIREQDPEELNDMANDL